VDPLKDIQASILSVDNGFNSRTKLLAEEGEEFTDVLLDLASEKKLAAAEGITFGVQGALPTSAKGEDGADDPPATDATKSLNPVLRIARSR
jgi:capsid protein